MTVIQKTFQYGAQRVSIETGEIALQADGAVVVRMGDTVVLVTAVVAKESVPGVNFLPLTVNHRESAYAGGQIPGGYFKREGRPGEREILISRLIDRPARPLFADGFTHELEVVSHVLSVDPEVEPDIPALIGASAALSIAGVPFRGPMAGARVGYLNGQFVLNPTRSQLKGSSLDLVVAGTETAVIMVESAAKLLPEDVMLEAVWYGHQSMQPAIQAIRELAQEVNRPMIAWKPVGADPILEEAIAAAFGSDISKAYQIHDKHDRGAEIKRLWEIILSRFNADTPDRSTELRHIYESLQRKIVRQRILEGFPRIDGRDTRTVRPLSIRTGVLPRTHGSALFTRGETQALVVATLGMGKDAQMIETVMGDERQPFMLHYNFPPYCVGELGGNGSPKRREIGHGKLAWKAVFAVLPSQESFPYVIRVVSEITASNGSSSMASVCGASLALMDAGVPLTAPVAGVAMGLIKEDNKCAILTDIIGDEDHLGDMDFKVAGSANGISALQMDIKTDGITKFIMAKALEQAKVGRLHILEHMSRVLAAPRTQLSAYAPTIKTIKIATDRIRDVIGKGGSTIRSITEETGASIEVEDDGTVRIAGVGQPSIDAAYERIRLAIGDIDIGAVYTGPVVKMMEFGAFVNLVPGKDGFLHVSHVSDDHVETIGAVLKEGQIIKVKVIEVDKTGRVRVTMKPSIVEGG